MTPEPVPEVVVSTIVQFAPPSPVAVPVNLKNTATGTALFASGRSDLLTVTLACETPPFWRSTLNVPVPAVPDDINNHNRQPSITFKLVIVNVGEVTVAAVARVVVFARTSALDDAPVSVAANVAAPVRVELALAIRSAILSIVRKDHLNALIPCKHTTT